MNAAAESFPLFMSWGTMKGSLWLIGLFLVWFLLQVWILPKLGLST